jgi:hypothetical protein
MIIFIKTGSGQTGKAQKEMRFLTVWNFIDANPLDTTATPGHFRDHGAKTPFWRHSYSKRPFYQARLGTNIV